MTLESSGARTSILAAALRCQPLLYGTRQLILALDLDKRVLFLIGRPTDRGAFVALWNGENNRLKSTPCTFLGPYPCGSS